jgi:hypothetical protein
LPALRKRSKKYLVGGPELANRCLGLFKQPSGE